MQRNMKYNYSEDINIPRTSFSRRTSSNLNGSEPVRELGNSSDSTPLFSEVFRLSLDSDLDNIGERYGPVLQSSSLFPFLYWCSRKVSSSIGAICKIKYWSLHMKDHRLQSHHRSGTFIVMRNLQAEHVTITQDLYR